MTTQITFNDFQLIDPLLKSLKHLGYETPTHIQSKSLPVLLNGDDLLAQAQTGTGKTAAFLLPILSQLDLKLTQPQALILAPTRELAIQVAEACQSYAKFMSKFYVLPIYGGQEYGTQKRGLKRGAHILVGTPGRLMDLMKRGHVDLSQIKTVVLDEADEMLSMGFIDDIKWILEKIPHQHQTALFSATMSKQIEKISQRYLKEPKKIQIKAKETTAKSIEQVYMSIPQQQKLDALTRFLEVEDTQATIIFARTKVATTELAEKLQARGYAVAALNGDMKQSQRERVIEQMKKERLDILVATDVAARGIDIPRVGHVINYDIPTDTESYIHRIGRTGRAGRVGKSLLFVTPREQRLLKLIENAVHSTITQIQPPSLQEMSQRRATILAEKIVNIVTKSKKIEKYQALIAQLLEQTEMLESDVAAALLYLLEQNNPMPTDELKAVESRPRKRTDSRRSDNKNKSRSKPKFKDKPRPPRARTKAKPAKKAKPKKR